MLSCPMYSILTSYEYYNPPIIENIAEVIVKDIPIDVHNNDNDYSNDNNYHDDYHDEDNNNLIKESEEEKGNENTIFTFPSKHSSEALNEFPELIIIGQGRKNEEYRERENDEYEKIMEIISM
eukprot:CAMPEP_0174825424 /NCGR_PEP_ID=MMETSP1107-20130205/42729_1 /TAXON_ID=36770 /ORGANISM="Paraphysomonas vestita, Strain GFlagA" /LENGTH=122 /DNA_ID=CAMNT_0016056999 /DNA_START=2669 /DNA_END=3037 /DNA_ORIENTATION=-